MLRVTLDLREKALGPMFV